MRYCLLARSEPEAPALPDRDPLVVTLTDGSIRNGYTIKLLNKTAQPLVVTVGVEALPVSRLALIGADREDGLEVTLKPDDVRSEERRVGKGGASACRSRGLPER